MVPSSTIPRSIPSNWSVDSPAPLKIQHSNTDSKILQPSVPSARRQRKTTVVAWKEPASVGKDPPAGHIRIIAVRHGQAFHNVAKGGSVVGAVTYRDPLLTPTGEKMALELRQTVASERIPYDLIVVSPLRRTLQTCSLAFGPRSDFSKIVVVQPLAAEHRFLGQRDGLGTRTSELRALYKEFKFPGPCDVSNILPENVLEGKFSGLSQPAEVSAAASDCTHAMESPRNNELGKESLDESLNLSVDQLSKLFPPLLTESWWDIPIYSTIATLSRPFSSKVSKGPVMHSVGGALKSGSQWLGGVFSDGLDMTLGKDQAGKIKSKMDGLGQSVSEQLNGLGWETEDDFRVRAQAFLRWLASALPPHVKRVAVVSHGGLLLQTFGGGKLKYDNCEWRVFDIKREPQVGYVSPRRRPMPIRSSSTPTMSATVFSSSSSFFERGTAPLTPPASLETSDSLSVPDMFFGDSYTKTNSQPSLSQNAQPGQASKHSQISASLSQTAATQSLSDWTCAMCTFSNPASLTHCNMCDSERSL
eukprot:gb/GEZN01006018.1/.p1 GENE.gb/GEZN01006018.1/~~gb/GEZN01006018.1/.p1  ORF type:complete len:531 (-),score=44.20 gb/GEZN01006018.1/:56-1648(-)